MKIEALDDDFIDSLVEDKPVFATGVLDGEEVETFFCPHCGNCEDPEHCVWGVQCPKCCAPQHEHCLDDRGALTGLHQERWDYAGRHW